MKILVAFYLLDKYSTLQTETGSIVGNTGSSSKAVQQDQDLQKTTNQDLKGPVRVHVLHLLVMLILFLLTCWLAGNIRQSYSFKAYRGFNKSKRTQYM